MSLTDLGIVALDILFGAAVLTAASCLVYLVSSTIREHIALSALRSSPRGADAGAVAPAVVSSVVRLADRRTARGGAGNLRPGVARGRASASS
jgi:hypothetical protein